MIPRIASPARVPAWRLLDARVPASLVDGVAIASDSQGFARLDLTIAQGRIASMTPAGTPGLDGDLPVLAFGGGIVTPCFVDAHTHLDKGHIWPRSPNPDGTFDSAIASVMQDRSQNWAADDVAARMEFSVRAAFAHGTAAIRTHIDSLHPQARRSWPVFAELRDRWRDRMDLQATPLLGVQLAVDPLHLEPVLEMVEMAGCKLLGAVTYMMPGLRENIAGLLRIAAERGYDVDFHVDETKDPEARSLRMVAEEAIAQKFPGRILAGHCCSLAVQGDDEARRTVDLVAEAGIAVVSLPMCNMYLQDRTPGGAAPRTPRWRGVTALHELKAAGVEVMIASDNTRDPFYAYGDLDMVEVWREGTRILHLDHPMGDWPRAIGPAPARVMRIEERGALRAGGAADFVMFRARSWTELFSRPQSDRTVVRNGHAIGDMPPAYADLDRVVMRPA